MAVSVARTAHFRGHEFDRTACSRRRLLMAGCGVVAGRALSSVAASAATAPILSFAGATRRFSVLYQGSRIGAHTIQYSSATGETRVRTDIDLLVKVAFFTVYAFAHHSQEIWRDGRLMSLTSQTVEHGETLHIEGAATPQGFRVVSKSGPFIASPDTLTSNSLWTPAVLAQETVVDAQYGGIIGVSARRISVEEIDIVASRIRATRYSLITPYLAGTIWYDAQGRWVRGEFERDGSKIQYRLDP